MVTTTLGKSAALDALAERREMAKTLKRIDDGVLPAGSPMHFYCISCGLIAGVLPENYIRRPPRLCEECLALKDLGWLDE